MITSVPLVLIPGTLCDRELFAHQLANLPTSTTVADITHASSIEDMATDVLNDAPARFAVAGLSLGGIVAAEIVRRAPERVLGLGLLDTNLDAAAASQIATRRRWASEVRAGLFTRLLADNLVTPLTNHPERHAQHIFDMAMRVGPAAFLRQNEAVMKRSDRRGVLDDLDMPVLVAWGACDHITPTAIHDDLVQRCVYATKAVIPDAGHLATIDQPAALTRVLRGWLQTCMNNKQQQEGQETNEYNSA